MLKNTEAIFKEISSFVQENNLTYQQIADMISNEDGINISGNPIRRYLAGESISYESKTSIYQWYLRNSKNPAILTASLSSIESTKYDYIIIYFTIHKKEQIEMFNFTTRFFPYFKKLSS